MPAWKLQEKPFWTEKGPDKTEKGPDKETLIKLNQYYEGVGTAARAQMITAANWLLTLIVALLAFIANEAFRLTAITEACREPTALGALAAIVGLALCGLTFKVVDDYYDHVNRNWMRATRCKYLVPDLYRVVVDEDVKDLTEGWPDDVASPDAFRKEAKAGDPSARVRSLFNFYRYGACAVGFVFLVALALQFVLRVCPAPAVGS